jgi:hypothetical protein
VALHDELAELRAEVGPQVFDDPVAFRAAFDDFIPEGSASTGEVSLLVGAIATGALQRLKDQLALGADPDMTIAVQGDLLARDRGTTETSGARWALSVLAHAIGAIPVAQVLTRPKPPPEGVSTVGRPSSAPASPGVVDPGPTRPIPSLDATRVVSQEPTPTTPPPPPSPTEPGERGRNPMMIGASVLLAVAAVIAVVLLFLVLRDDSDPDGTADDSLSTSSSEEVLAEIEMSEAGKTVRLQLVADGDDASIVLLSEVDGEYVEVDREATSCPYLDTAYDPGLEDEGNSQIAFGWQNEDTDGYGAYGEVKIDEDLLILYEPGEEEVCPT